MRLKTLAPLAALCILAGCTTSPGGVPDSTRVDSWGGYDLREMIPPLELMAVANETRARGRVIGGGRRDGGAYLLTPGAELPSACADRIAQDDGPLVGCTVRTLSNAGWMYRVFVSDQYPEWYRELVATREFGHVGQSEIGAPITDAGFVSPTASLIRRLGG